MLPPDRFLTGRFYGWLNQEVQIIETRPKQQGFVSDVAVPVLQNVVVGGGVFLLTLTIGNVATHGHLDFFFHRQTIIFTIAMCLAISGFSLLCVVRGAWDEIDALLYRYAEHRNNLDVSEILADIRILIQECERLEKEKSRLHHRLIMAEQPKKQRRQPEPPREVIGGPNTPDPYAGVVERFVEQYEATGSASIQMNQQPDEDVMLARKLVSHYIAHRTFAKHSALKESRIGRREWSVATQFLGECGAIEKQGKAYVLAVESIDRVEPLIEQKVRQRAQIRASGVHTPA